MDRPQPYMAPHVQAQPCKSWPQDGARRAAFVLLDTRTGHLTAEPAPAGPAQSSFAGYYDPARDLWIIGHGWHRQPAVLGWCTYDSDWTRAADSVTEHLRWLAPAAQELLDLLAPVPGTSDWDWTPRATTAASAMAGGVFTSGPSDDIDWTEALRPERSIFGVVAVSEILEEDPSLIDPSWADISDAELDKVAAYFTGAGRRWLPSEELRVALCKRFRIGGDDPALNRHTLYPVRARVDLRAARDRLLTEKTGLPAKPACDLIDLDHLPADFTPSATDADLARIAARMDADFARHQKIAVTGTIDVLHDLRARARARIRREASDAGRRVAELEAQLVDLRATRNGLTAQVIGFHEKPEWDAAGVNFAEVGRLASMTRQGARATFGPLAADEEFEAAAAAGLVPNN